MILVDTSVFINYFKGIDCESVSKFDKILAEGIEFGINDFIFQEILQGSSDENEYNTLLSYLETLKFYTLKGRQSFSDAARMYFECRRKGVTVRSTIDLLITQTALENKLLLLHNDNDYVNISKVIKNLRFY